MNNPEDRKSAAIITGIFVLVAAIISGIFLLVSTGNIGSNSETSNKPFSEGDQILTAAIATPVKVGDGQIYIHNSLALPIEYSVDKTFRGEILPYSTETVLLGSFPVRVEFDVINQTASDGTLIGDPMGGIYPEVNNGTNITITNVIGDEFYFNPIISNNLGVDCEIVVNEGTIVERRSGHATAGSQNVGFGYYRLFDNSNVTIYCGNSAYYWGIHYEGDTMHLAPLIKTGTGILWLTINP